MFVCGARALETMNHGNVVVVQMQPIATVSQLSFMFCWFVGVVDGGGGGFSYTRTHESGGGNSDVVLQIAQFIKS